MVHRLKEQADDDIAFASLAEAFIAISIFIELFSGKCRCGLLHRFFLLYTTCSITVLKLLAMILQNNYLSWAIDGKLSAANNVFFFSLTALFTNVFVRWRHQQ